MSDESSTPSPRLIVLVVVLALASGAGNSFLTNAVLDFSCPAECSSASFSKPIFVTLIAFLGMAASAVDVVASRTCANRARRSSSSQTDVDEAYVQHEDDTDDAADQRSPTTGNDRDCVKETTRRYAPLFAPAVLDTLATLMQVAAALFITAGAVAALRGTLLWFTAAVARCLRVRDASASSAEWLGITVAVAGVGACSLSAALNASSAADGDAGSSTGRAGLVAAISGIVLATGSNAVQALQFGYETQFLEAEAALSPAEVNAAEGFMGVAVCALLLALFEVVPLGNDAGHIEDTVSTMCCIHGAPGLGMSLVALCFLFALSSAAYMRLSLLVGVNFRAFVLVARAALVWAAELATFYILGSARFGGVSWSSYSWLQAVGLVLLAVGGAQLYLAQLRRLALARTPPVENRLETEVVNLTSHES